MVTCLLYFAFPWLLVMVFSSKTYIYQPFVFWLQGWEQSEGYSETALLFRESQKCWWEARRGSREKRETVWDCSLNNNKCQGQTSRRLRPFRASYHHQCCWRPFPPHPNVPQVPLPHDLNSLKLWGWHRAWWPLIFSHGSLRREEYSLLPWQWGQLEAVNVHCPWKGAKIQTHDLHGTAVLEQMNVGGSSKRLTIIYNNRTSGRCLCDTHNWFPNT